MPKKIDYASMYTLRKDGRYMGYYKDPVTERRKAAYDRDPEVLYRKIQELEKPRELTFKEAAEAWWVNHVEGLARGTQAGYNGPFEYIVAEHGKKVLRDITAADINKMMLREKSKNYSYKHAARVKSLYGQIFNYAIAEMGQNITNPAAAVKVPTGLKRTKRAAPEDDVIQIIINNIDKPFGLFPLLLIYTGMRSGEACALQWGDVDFDNKLIHVSKSLDQMGTPKIKAPKTENSVRDVPLLPGLAKALVRPKAAKDTDYIFAGDRGGPLTCSGLRYQWLLWCRSVGLAEQVEKKYTRKKTGIEYTTVKWVSMLTAHQLRHGYATLLYEAGVDELSAQNLMGHADVGFTRKIYTDLRAKHKAKDVDKLAAKFEEIAGQ